MNKVLILTNGTRLGNVNGANKNFNGIENLKADSILVYKKSQISDEKPSLEKSTSLQDGNIFFVFDGVSYKDFEKFCYTRIEDDIIFVLYHTHGLKEFPKYDWVKPISGTHIGDKKGKYAEVMWILTDQTPDKMKQIVEKIFLSKENIIKNKLETVLKFLHGCLVPKNDVPEFIKAKDELGKFEMEVKTFYEKYKNKENFEDYTKDLSDIRDKLLENVLAK